MKVYSGCKSLLMFYHMQTQILCHKRNNSLVVGIISYVRQMCEVRSFWQTIYKLHTLKTPEVASACVHVHVCVAPGCQLGKPCSSPSFVVYFSFQVILSLLVFLFGFSSILSYMNSNPFTICLLLRFRFHDFASHANLHAAVHGVSLIPPYPWHQSEKCLTHTWTHTYTHTHLFHM